MLAAFFLAIGATAIFYALIGYPLLLAYRFRYPAPAVRKDSNFRPSISILMAVRNGELFLEKKLQSLLALHYPRELVEILVVSDGSTDATDAIAEAYATRGVRLFRVPKGGKAAALNEGLLHTTGEILFLADVRQTIHPDSLAHLAAHFADSTVGAVTGEPRFLNPDQSGEEADMEIYWRFELWARRRHSEIFSALNTTGWIYAIRRNLMSPIPADTLIDDLIIPLRALLQGYRVIVEPKALAYDLPKIQGGEFRRKIRTLGGLWQVHFRTPGLLSSANRMRFHFLSYKTSRLALPWAILLVWGSTVALPDSPFRSFLLADELLLLGLAASDLFVPKNSRLKRISSPARTFLVMNAASLLSLCVFFVPAGVLWRPTRVKPAEPKAHRTSAR